MRVKLWGTRGSVPSPGPETIRYGGNTSCVQVTLSDGTMLALDAGTGIRSLGLALAEEPTRLHILLTHLHLDHIQGLVFFAPAFRPQTEIVIWGPASPEASLRDRHRPLHLRPALAGRGARAALRRVLPPLSRDRVGDRPGADPRRLGRPTAGRRSATGSPTATAPLTYIPDHEPALGADLDDLEEDWISGFDLARDADLLIHDGQYSDDEYPEHVGWGHSSISHALSFARRAGRERTLLFHHDPLHSDDFLDELDRKVRERWAGLGGAPNAVELAFERAELELAAIAPQIPAERPRGGGRLAAPCTSRSATSSGGR